MDIEHHPRPGPSPAEPHHLDEAADSVLSMGVPGDTAYVLEFAGVGATAFGQVRLDEGPDWCTGLFVAPDLIDLTADDPGPFRRHSEYGRFYAELAAIGWRWHLANEAFDGEEPFAGRAGRDSELRALYERWPRLPGLAAARRT